MLAILVVATSLVSAAEADATSFSEAGLICGDVGLAPGAITPAPIHETLVGEPFPSGSGEAVFNGKAEEAPPASDFTATVNWGDGATTAATVGEPNGPGCYIFSTPAHTYTVAGSYTRFYTLHDTSSGEEFTFGSFEVDVKTDVPQPLGGPSSRVVEPTVGSTWNGIVAEFADPGLTLYWLYTAQIQWEPGAPSLPGVVTEAVASQGSKLIVSGSHAYPQRYNGPIDVSLAYNGRPVGTWSESVVSMKEPPTTPAPRLRFVGHPLLALISGHHHRVEYALLFRLDRALPQTGSSHVQASVEAHGHRSTVDALLGHGGDECYVATANNIAHHGIEPGQHYPFMLVVAGNPDVEVKGDAVVRGFTTLARMRSTASKELRCG